MVVVDLAPLGMSELGQPKGPGSGKNQVHHIPCVAVGVDLAGDLQYFISHHIDIDPEAGPEAHGFVRGKKLGAGGEALRASGRPQILSVKKDNINTDGG